MKRLCLFAGYDKSGIVHDYAVYYIKELSKLADVYYFMDVDNVKKSELAKLAPYTKGAFAKRHGKYDFGSWQELIKKIGWKEIEKYDELVLANDSCYGPIFPLAPIFTKMEKSGADFWGMTEWAKEKKGLYPKHIQSYFVGLNSDIIKNVQVRKFFNDIKIEQNKNKVVENYEIGFSALLEKLGFKSKTLICNLKNNPNSYWKSCCEKGMPFIKVCCFTNSLHAEESVSDVNQYIEKHTKYSNSLITNHLNSLKINLKKLAIKQVFNKKISTKFVFDNLYPNQKLKNSFFSFLFNLVLVFPYKTYISIKKFIFLKKITRHGYFVIKICKIPLWRKKV